jgi:hypothetical protein
MGTEFQDGLGRRIGGKEPPSMGPLRLKFNLGKRPSENIMRFLLLLLLLLFAEPPEVFAQTLFNVDFQKDEPGKSPSGWSSQEPEKVARVYKVQAEEGNKFLRADARRASIQIGYESKWDVKKYPVLSWKWRAVVFPEHSNERKKSGNDSVLGVYAVFGGWPVPSSIKYIWSDTLPVGVSFDSPHSGKTKIIVVRSGRGMMEKWVSENRDVLADYRKLFGGGEKDPVSRGIAVLTDSNETNSRAVGDYDNFAVRRKGGK